jgi:hypothetical protein
VIATESQAPPSRLHVTDEFGYWFSGFFDGEGTLLAMRENDRQLTLKIQILLRDDDGSVNRWIQENLGCGKIYPHAVSRQARVKTKPGSMFRIRDIRDLAEIVVPLFDKYPLHSKKAREYLIWKKLLLLRYQETMGRSPHSTPYSQEYCTEFDSAIKQLRAIRKYREHADLEATQCNTSSPN